jgi:hypothetical protein
MLDVKSGSTVLTLQGLHNVSLFMDKVAIINLTTHSVCVRASFSISFN